MLIIFGIIAAAALGGIIFLFLSPKSSGVQKKAALISLAVSGLALIVCAVIIALNSGEEEDPYASPFMTEELVPVENPHILELLIFLAVLLVVLGFVIYMGMKERKKQAARNPDNKISGGKSPGAGLPGK